MMDEGISYSSSSSSMASTSSSKNRCLICNGHIGNRKRIGPNSRKKDFSILIDTCLKCGLIYPVDPERLTYEEAKWATRWNDRIRSISCETCKYGKGIGCKMVFLSKVYFNPILHCIDREYYYWKSTNEEEFIKEEEMEI